MPPFADELEAVGFVGSETMVRSPKSARRAWPSWSIRILALVKEGVLESGSATKCSNSYPLQVPVYHRLAVHIYQTLSDVFELSEEDVSDWYAEQSEGTIQAQTDSHLYAP